MRSNEARIALVTGASRGIGREIARRLAASGYTVGVHFSSNEAAARQTLDELAGSGHQILRADLGREGSGVELAEAALLSLGPVDLLVNNAGVFTDHAPDRCDLATWRDSWRRILAVNLVAAADLCFVLARKMIERDGGKIVNIGSRGAFRGEPEAPAYGASKAGLHAMSQSLARQLAPHGIMVYAIAPGWVDTDMAAPYLDGSRGEAVLEQSPLGRIATAGEIARTVLHLAGDETDFLTGCIIDVNGASYLRT